jgi:CheY-like chemotaxis protein
MANILVVDDDPGTLLAVQEALKRAGHQTDGALDGFAALQLVRSQRPDLIICDIEMPGMTGFEFQRTLAADPEFRSIPLVFLTGNANAMEGRLGRELTDDEFIEKPFSFSKLLAVISTHLNR